MRHWCGAVLLFTLLTTATAGTGQESPSKRFAFGLEYLSQQQYLSIKIADPSFKGPLPPKVMLSPLPPPGNQEQQASCVGWAVAYAMKTIQENTKRKWGVDPPDHAFSPAYIYNQIKNGSSCSAKSTYGKALDLLVAEGVAPLTAFPYDPQQCRDVPGRSVKKTAAQYKVVSWARVAPCDEGRVKAHLAGGSPVLIGMDVDDAFRNLHAGTVYQGLNGISLDGHAMAVVGYDDSKSAFLLMNSWGSAWADGGFGWVSFHVFPGGVRECFVTQEP